MSYFLDRLSELGITNEQNRMTVNIEGLHGLSKTVEVPIFTQSDKDDIVIKFWDLNRNIITYPNEKKNSDPLHKYAGTPDELEYQLVRLNPERVTDGNKYLMPKGGGIHPWLPPALIDKYEKGEHIETLCMTEGVFKAFKGSLCGFDIVGLTSITHYAESTREKQIHVAIRRIIDRCKVKKVVMIYDGDCLNISDKDLELKRELTARPKRFLQSMMRIRELLIDYDVAIYFAHIQTEEIEGNPKGLDDLLCAFPDKTQEIRDDIYTLGKVGTYFYRLDVRTNHSKLRNYFSLKNINQFISRWQDKIKGKEFVFNGDLYVYDEKKEQYVVSVPKNLRQFFRVNNTFYKNVELWNPEQNRAIPTRVRYDKSTIQLDFDNNAPKKIPAYEAFVYYPDNINYQRVLGNCYNLYEEIPFSPERGECPTILSFFKHIFEEQIELGLDYIQLLYQQPRQKLPILCLVSNERNTGKTTFLNLLNEIFGGNSVTVGNSEISSEFNALTVGKLIVGVDETALAENDKITERLKMLSTAETVALQRKGKDHEIIKNYTKYILVSNNETRFIYTQEEEVRFWVRKINPIAKEDLDVDIQQKMVEEIPAFLGYLNNRRLSTKKEYRSWFNPSLLETEALKRLKEQQRPKAVTEFIEAVKDLFIQFPKEEYEVSYKIVKLWIPYFSRALDNEGIKRVLEDHLKIKPVREASVRRIKIPYSVEAEDNISTVLYHRDNARVRYLLKAEQFLNEEELSAMREQLPSPADDKPAEIEQNELDF